MAHRLYSVSVGIDDECRIVVGMILQAYAGSSIVATTGDQRSVVKGTHGRAIGSAEADMHPRQRRDGTFDRDREFHTELPGHGTVVRPSSLKVHRTDETERTQRRIVESAATLQVGHTK